METKETVTPCSGLEALAFVVAGQYQELRDLRGVNDEYRQLKDQYDNVKHDYHETERCRSEWAKMFEKCSAEKEELQIKTAEVENENDELKQEIKSLKQSCSTAESQSLNFYDARECKPAHGQVCLCLETHPSCMVCPQDFLVLRYNDKAKYWDERFADVDNADHDDGVYDYGDYKVRAWLPLSDIIGTFILKAK